MKEESFSPPLHIYRASAGSGKTFLLASEYLCLLFERPEKYREILAVTFTNKATEEMKHRILGELKKIALGEETGYASIIKERFPAFKSGQQLALQADRIYRTILHDYAKFSVSTIDSFVQQVIRSFAYEIGLDAGFELQLNQDLVKEELADRLFELLETNEDLLQWVQQIAIDRIENGESWDFRSTLLDFASEIFKERFHHFEANMQQLEQPSKAFETLKKSLQAVIKEMESPMKEFAAQANAILLNSGLQAADFSYGKSGFINYFNRIENKKDFNPGPRCLEAVDDLSKWTSKSKTPASVLSRVEAIYPALNELLSQCIQHYQQHNVEYRTALSVLRQLNNLSLLQVLAAQLADYRRDNNLLLISDTQQLLRELVRDNDAPFIYEKIGNRYQHFLLDEFQDTSTFQWDNFRPLVEQSVSTGHFNLVVGDVKQSIYRWRSGDWRLLQEQVKKDIGAANVKDASLKENYRSRENIIHVNNFIFHIAPLLLQENFNVEMAVVQDSAILARLHANGYFNIIAEAYADATQQIPSPSKPGGNVEIRFFQKEDSRSPNSWKPAADEWLCTHIDTLISDKGIRPEQITILTRNNNDARRLIDLLLVYQQSADARARYGLVSADALLVNASPAIQLLVAALRFLVNEKDELARAELVQANAIRLGLDISNTDWYRKDFNHALQQLPEAFRHRKRYLLQTALYECVEELITIFSIDQWTSEQAYILAFRDMVNNVSARGKPDIREFLQWWQEEGEQKALPLSAAANAIQVMTIHKSKGLAFDVVIIPYADWKLTNDKGMLWSQWGPDESGIEWVPVLLKKDLDQTRFAYDYFEEQLMARMDALNMLYVALTRTRQAMYIMAPAPSVKKDNEGGMKTIADLLWQCLHPTEYALPTTLTDYAKQFTASELIVEGFVEPVEKKDISTESIRINPVTMHASLLQDLREPATQELLLHSAVTEQQQIGQLAHLALARVKTLDELDITLEKMQLEGELTTELLPAVKERVAMALENEQLAQWFGSGYQALNEKAILLKGGAVRRPDKVLVGANETILLDFKFTQEASPSHGRQLQQYHDLLVEMGYPSVRSFIYYGYNRSLVPLAQLAVQQGQLFG